MPRISANIGFLWNDRPLPERIAAAAAAGFEAVECHQPFDHETDEIRVALDRAGVPLLSLNTGFGRNGPSEFGVVARPGREEEAERLLRQAVEYAAALDCGFVNVMAGTTGRAAGCEDAFRHNLALGCEMAAEHGVTLLIEPLSPASAPNAHCSLVEQAAETITAVGADNLRILFDCFHVQTLQGNVTERLVDHLPLIGHIQIAAVPGRSEPDHGELDHRWLLGHLDEIGYEGWVGAEYHPRTSVEAGLGWFREYHR